LNIGLTEILIAAFILIFLFGAKRIPDMFKAVAQSIKGFRKELKDDNQEETLK